MENLKITRAGYYGYDTLDCTDSRSADWEKQREARGFDKWELRLQTLIPRIRKISKDQEKKTYELKQLKILAEKYGYKLIKE